MMGVNDYPCRKFQLVYVSKRDVWYIICTGYPVCCNAGNVEWLIYVQYLVKTGSRLECHHHKLYQYKWKMGDGDVVNILHKLILRGYHWHYLWYIYIMTWYDILQFCIIYDTVQVYCMIDDYRIYAYIINGYNTIFVTCVYITGAQIMAYV